jgi:membrane protein YqaA with SNARE-associated domain
VARAPQNWWLYAVAATAGSVIGGFITYRIGLKGGEKALETRIPKKRLDRINRWSRKHTSSAIFIPALLPPPFPLSPFLLVAGAIKIRRINFLLLFSSARLLRFGILAFLSRGHAGWILALLSRYSHPLLIVAVLIIIASSLFAFYHFRKRLHGSLGSRCELTTTVGRIGSHLKPSG